MIASNATVIKRADEAKPARQAPEVDVRASGGQVDRFVDPYGSASSGSVATSGDKPSRS